MFLAENPDFKKGVTLAPGQLQEPLTGPANQAYAQTLDSKTLLNREKQFINFGQDYLKQDPYADFDPSNAYASTLDTNISRNKDARSVRLNRF